MECWNCSWLFKRNLLVGYITELNQNMAWKHAHHKLTINDTCRFQELIKYHYSKDILYSIYKNISYRFKSINTKNSKLFYGYSYIKLRLHAMKIWRIECQQRMALSSDNMQEITRRKRKGLYITLPRPEYLHIFLISKL